MLSTPPASSRTKTSISIFRVTELAPPASCRTRATIFKTQQAAPSPQFTVPEHSYTAINYRAPNFSNISITALNPRPRAWSSALMPCASVALTSAPAAARVRTMSAWPSWAHRVMAGVPPLLAFLSAPSAKACCKAARSLARMAVNKAVLGVVLGVVLGAALGAAPALAEGSA